MRKEDVQKNPRRAGLVTRYHVFPRVRDQSVGEHSWQLMRIYLTIFGQPRAEVFSYIIKHDLGEVQTGDPPYPVKARNPVLKGEMDRLEDEALASMNIQMPDLTSEEHVRFKFCDLLDCAEHGTDEFLMGNKFMLPVADQIEGLTTYLRKMSSDDRNKAVRYCGDSAVMLDRGYLHECSPLLALDYDNRYRENYRGI